MTCGSGRVALQPDVHERAEVPGPHAAFVGIDVAFAKKKRLPLVVCTRQGSRLEPLPLRNGGVRPPHGRGNRALLDGGDAARAFASQTVEYLKAVESEFDVRICRVAIDAPSDPCSEDSRRRRAEIELDGRGMSCFTTPSEADFETLCKKGRAHLQRGGAESMLPGANQLWMLSGFALFRELRRHWTCLEVFPYAIAHTLGMHELAKSTSVGVEARLRAVAVMTGWPPINDQRNHSLSVSLNKSCFGARHDRLEAYMAAWVASLAEQDREPLGQPPDDVIWVPKC